jgi:hypothetical protein
MFPLLPVAAIPLARLASNPASRWRSIWLGNTSPPRAVPMDIALARRTQKRGSRLHAGLGEWQNRRTDAAVDAELARLEDQFNAFEILQDGDVL